MIGALWWDGVDIGAGVYGTCAGVHVERRDWRNVETVVESGD